MLLGILRTPISDMVFGNHASFILIEADSLSSAFAKNLFNLTHIEVLYNVKYVFKIGNMHLSKAEIWVLVSSRLQSFKRSV